MCLSADEGLAMLAPTPLHFSSVFYQSHSARMMKCEPNLSNETQWKKFYRLR
jgi:hypothetical protein